MNDPTGSACLDSSTCASGNCVDGVCCDTACNGLCVACTAAKTGVLSNGVCGPVKANTDPDNECFSSVCNGTGACSPIPAGDPCYNAGSCATGFCVDGVCCTQSSCTPVDSCHVAVCGLGTGTCNNYPRVCPGGGTCANGLCPGQCTGTFGFHGLPKLPIYYAPSNLAMGDIDGDGDLDLIVTSFYVASTIGDRGAILSYLNDGTGTFALGNGAGPGPQNSGGALIVTDMNNDGYQDAVETGTYSTIRALVVKFATAGGLASVEMMVGIPIDATKAVATDLNNDGYRDVVMKSTNGALFAVTNNAGASLAPAVNLFINGFDDFDAADLNGDGNADLVLANSATGIVGVRFGNGNNTFGAPIDYPAVSNVNGARLRDVNADGKLDLVANNGIGTMVLLNLGNGVFASGQTYSGGSTDIGDVNGDLYPDILGSTTLFNNGDGTFSPLAMDYVPNTGSAVGDLDGDGTVDLAWLEGGGVHLSFNHGNGSFVRPYLPQNFAVPNNRQMMPVDLNGDNLQDLALASTSTNTVGVRINNGNGTYAAQIDYPTGAGPIAMAAADMNADGFMDLVTSGSGNITVLLNNGGGTLAVAANYSVGNTAASIVAADLNGDAYPDIARMTSTTTLKFMLNNGNGTLGASVDGVSRPFEPAALGAGDLNADGHIDLVSMSTWGRADVYINNGNGGFGAPTSMPLIDFPGVRSLILVDLNGDGSLDVATASDAKAARYVNVVLNDGDGNFRGHGLLSLPDYENDFLGSVMAADVDGNGYNDLLVKFTLGGLRVYLNNGNATFASDLRYSTNGDTFIPTDIDGDGITELLSNTGALHTRACFP